MHEDPDDRSSGYCRLLAQTWPFNELPSSVLGAMVEEMQERQYAAGEELIAQGQRSRHLLVLVEGLLRVAVQDGEQCYEIAETGGVTIIGEMGLLTEEPCTATVTAVTPARALALPAEAFHALAARHQVLGVALSSLVARRLGQAPGDALAGKVLHGYRIRRSVGRGGMAVVYEAESVANGERVALKMLSHRFIHNLDVQHRFEREIQICRSLRHPHIARILDHFTAFGTNFMVLEFCDGVTLDQVVSRQGPLAEDQVRSIVRQLAGALAYAHRQGVCHRDLKPSNVMIADDGTVKLMDFGLARSLEFSETALTCPGQILGTPRYMPPEQLAGKPIDHRADLFALGSTVYEMLKGEPLVTENNLLGILRRYARWELPAADEVRPGLSDDLYEVLKQSLAADPAERTLDLERLARWDPTLNEVA